MGIQTCKYHDDILKAPTMPCWECKPEALDRPAKTRSEIWYYLRSLSDLRNELGLPKGMNVYKEGPLVTIEFKKDNGKLARIGTGIRSYQDLSFNEWRELFIKKFSELNEDDAKLAKQGIHQ